MMVLKSPFTAWWEDPCWLSPFGNTFLNGSSSLVLYWELHRDHPYITSAHFWSFSDPSILLLSFSFHFSFFVLVDKSYEKQKYYVIFFFKFCLACLALQTENIVQKITQPIFVFGNFINQNENQKMGWKAHNYVSLNSTEGKQKLTWPHPPSLFDDVI